MNNPYRIPIFIALAIILSFNTKSFSQTLAQNDSTKTKLINAAKAIMSEAGTCALITLDEKGLPSVRVMDPFLPENDLTVWFGTNSKSRKVRQIKKNPNVTLYYLEKNSAGYVVIHGKAYLIDDEKEKENKWKPEWEAFYSDRSDMYLLIKVIPKNMEIISYTYGITGDPETWKTPEVYFDK